MKKKSFFKMSAIALICAVLVATACKGPNDLVNPTPMDGYGTVSINFGGGNARTLLPSEIDISKLHYVLTFAQTDGSGNLTETHNGSGQLTLQLNIGTWNLIIRGYNSASDASDTAKAVVSYTQNGIIIPYGNSVTINARLLPNLDNLTQDGSGTLRYVITFPEGAAGVLKVYTHPANTLVGSPIVLSSAENRDSLELVSGNYEINVSMEYQGKIKTWSELAHINDNAITEAIVGHDDFTDSLPPPGPVTINLSMDKFTMTDDGKGVFAGLSPIILKKGTDTSETIAADGLVVVAWKIGDTVLGTGNNITLNAAFFPMGIYTLNLTFVKDGKPWLGSLTFEVTHNLTDDYFELITSGGGVYWGDGERIDSDRRGTYRVIGSSAVPPNKVYIPAYYNGLPVTEIGMRETSPGSWRGAFMYNSNITAIHIPDTVTYISNSSFRGTSIASITIPTGVLFIGPSAFESCQSLTSVIIPEGVKAIDSSAFANCTNLTSIRIPASVRLFGGGTGGAIGNCPNLTSIIVDNNNQYYASEGGILFNKSKTQLIAFPSASGVIIIPEGITSFGMDAFRGTNVTSVTIPVGVTHITYGVFASCRNLTSVILPEGLLSISQAAFMFTGLTSVTIPASVTSIGTRAFGDGCNSLTSVTIKGTISAENLEIDDINTYWNSLPGDLGHKYLAGGIGTYTTTNPGNNSVWTKK